MSEVKERKKLKDRWRINRRNEITEEKKEFP